MRLTSQPKKFVFSLIMAAMLSFQSGCTVRIFDLQPENTIVAPEPTSMETPGTPMPVAYVTVTSGLQPLMTNTPPIQLGPTKITEATPIELSELVMINGATGWGIAHVPGGMGQMIVRTQDGGFNWRNVTPPQLIAKYGSRSVTVTGYFLDTSNAWVIYHNEENWAPKNGVSIWHTTDGGNSWEEVALPLEGYSAQHFQKIQISFLNANIGWIFASLGGSQDREFIGLYTTHDGGKNWAVMVSSDSANLPSKGRKDGASFRNATEGWISGRNAPDEPGVFLWRTLDGGNTWTTQTLPPLTAEDIPQGYLNDRNTQCSLTPLKFVDFQFQYAWTKMYCQGGALTEPIGILYWTYDSGSTWRMYRLPKAEGNVVFYGIYQGWYSQEADSGAATPFEIKSTIDGGSTWNVAAQTAWDSKLQFITGAVGWGVVNYEGRLAMVKTVDGGNSWEQIYPSLLP